MPAQDPRRASPRHAYTAPVRFSIEGERGGDEIAYSGYLRDVGFGGAFVHSFNSPPAGSILRMRFPVPFQDAPVEVRAQVVRGRSADDAGRVEETGFAVRFLSRDPYEPPPPPPEAEKREVPRRAFRASLRFFVREPHFFTGFARDISTGGIFVQTFSLPELDQRVVVRFRVPYLDREHEAPVTVVWTRPEEPGRPLVEVGFGGRFVELPPEIFDAINRYVRTHEPEFFA
jgi:hypothetical protein